MSDDDLVRRLRTPLWGDGVNPEEDAYDPVRLEAADRIEALAARVERLEEAIASYANFDPESADEILARAALGEAS